MKIGNLEIENPVFLAPMAGVTDLPFRLRCKRMGCGLVYTEMVSAKGILYNNSNTKELLRIDPEERPVAIQLFGSDPELLADMARKIEPYADIIDINMGCPAPKIVKNGEGSALMKDAALIGRIVKAVSSAIKKPLTIKIRKGFNPERVNCVEAAKIAEENGAAAIAIHGRTTDQYYSGEADWESIARVKESVAIPVIGNGDINSPEDAKAMLEQTGCDAVLIGRAAQGNPFLFRRCTEYLKTGKLLPETSIEERVSFALDHAREMAELKGEWLGIREMRKHLAWYTRGMPGAARLRLEINRAETMEDVERLFFSAEFRGLNN